MLFMKYDELPSYIDVCFLDFLMHTITDAIRQISKICKFVVHIFFKPLLYSCWNEGKPSSQVSSRI